MTAIAAPDAQGVFRRYGFPLSALSEGNQLFVRRFDLEHIVRCFKQTLN